MQAHGDLVSILFRATPVKNVWPPRSQSAGSQVSAVLFYARTAKFVRAQICVGDMRVFLSYKRRVGNIISVKTMVQRLPDLPDLLRQPCLNEMIVKETVPLNLFKVQSSNFTERVGAPPVPLPTVMYYTISSCGQTRVSWHLHLLLSFH